MPKGIFFCMENSTLMYLDYEYQLKAISDIENILTSHIKTKQENMLICIPTGGGKTVIGARGFKKFLDNNKGKKILVLVPLQCLIGQTYKTFTDVGINVSVFHNQVKTDIDGNKFKMGLGGDVIISMPETYCNDLAAGKNRTIPESFKPFAIGMDEAHKMTSDQNQQIWNRYSDSVVIGFTASPYRPQNKEGEHLQEWYKDNLHQYVSIKELIELKRLVPPKYYEYGEDDHIFNSWLTQAESEDPDKRSTVIFTSNTDQSLKLKSVFLENGVSAEIITSGSTVVPDILVKNQSHEERNEIYRKFKNREITVLISVNALCEGWDEPSANIVILARGILNKALYQQMVGRVLRSYGTKEYALVLDFGGNVERFGPVEEFQWEMVDGDERQKRVKDGETLSEKEYKNSSKIFFKCHCHHVYDIKKNLVCPSCYSKANVKVVDTVGNLLKDRFPEINLGNLASIKQIVSSIKGAKNYPDLDFKKSINKRYKATIFDTNGNMTSDFDFINHIIDVNKMKTTTKIIIS